jgi:hypothetical protein
MNQNLREKATQLLDVANNKGKGMEASRPPPCPACGMMMALPESSAQLMTPQVR